MSINICIFFTCTDCPLLCHHISQTGWIQQELSQPIDPVNFDGDSSGISQTVIRVCCSVPARLLSGSLLYNINQLKHRACERFYTGREGVSQTLVRFTNEKDDKIQRLLQKNYQTENM